MVSNSGTHHRHLRQGWALVGGAGAKLPNFPLDSRPECAGKTASLPPDALARYQADRQLFPPEQYLWANLLTRDGAWRYMRSSEKESAMGFPEGFTLSAWLTSDATRDVQGVEFCRLDLLGQSLHVGLLKVFTQQLFPPSGTMQRETNVAEAAGASSEDDVMERLVRAISQRSTHQTPLPFGPANPRAIVGPPTPLVEMADSYLQPLELCRPHQCFRIASTSRQSALAHEDAVVRWRALASCP